MTPATPGRQVNDLFALAEIVRALKARGKRVVHCHGDFDRLQVDDVLDLREAKAMGDVLVVTVTPDQVPTASGQRPVFPESLRAELVSAVDVVDYVAPSHLASAAETIRALCPSVFAVSLRRGEHGIVLSRTTTSEQEAARAVGTELCFTTNARQVMVYHECFSPEVNNHLEQLRQRFTTAELIQYLEQLRSLNVVLIGETILDEYIYCDAMGKSGKEPVLAMRYLSKERHAGGALAIANHLANFCRKVTMYSYLGADDPQEEFVRTHLSPRVDARFIYKADSPTILKRRFLDYYSRGKLFAVYEINDDPLSKQEEDALSSSVEPNLTDCDLAVVADFGHGLITEQMVALLNRQAPFLSANTQLNAANVGYHTISKYPHVDYVSIHEGELRLDSRCRKGDLRLLTANLAARIGAQMVMVTRGKHGSLLYHRESGFHESPAFGTKIVDRIGAGDAVFALTSLCAACGVPPDALNFLGNLIGAEAVSIVGNREAIDRKRLAHAIDNLLVPFEQKAA